MPDPVDQSARPFMERIERLHADLESERGKYMAACKVIREDVKVVFQEAKDAGCNVKALRGLIKWRALEKRQDLIESGLDDDEAAVYVRLIETLGALGLAAASAAGYEDGDNGDSGDNDDQRDLRPRHMTQPDARPDEEHLARVGRGH